MDASWERLAARLRRPLGRRVLLRHGHVRELEELGSSCAEASSNGGPRVLVAALRNWTTHTAYESVIAQALRLRGAHVGLVTCGGGQPLCELGWSRRVYPLPCDRCAWFTDRIAGAARLETYRLADEFAWDSDGRRAPESPGLIETTHVDPREAANISVPWVLRTPEIEAAPEGRAAEDDMAVSAAAVERAAERILERFRPDVLFLVNGLFAAERVFRQVADSKGIRAPTYEIAPRGSALVFSQGVPAPSTTRLRPGAPSATGRSARSRRPRSTACWTIARAASAPTSGTSTRPSTRRTPCGPGSRSRRARASRPCSPTSRGTARCCTGTSRTAP